MIEKAIAKLNGFEKPKGRIATIIDHLIKRVREDEGLAEDVLKESKTWNGCWAYITAQAKKQAVAGCACIEDEQVYEWAEDYFRAKDEPKPAAKPKANKPEKKSTTGGQSKKPVSKPVSTVFFMIQYLPAISYRSDLPKS